MALPFVEQHWRLLVFKTIRVGFEQKPIGRIVQVVDRFVSPFRIFRMAHVPATVVAAAVSSGVIRDASRSVSRVGFSGG